MAGLVAWLVAFAREVNRGIAVGYGRESFYERAQTRCAGSKPRRAAGRRCHRWSREGFGRR